MHRSSVNSVVAFVVLLAAISAVAILGGTGMGTAVDSADLAGVDESISTAPASVDPAPSPTGSRVRAAQPEFDRTTFNVTVAADGSARWTFEYERPLGTSDAVEEFETYAQTFESEETDLYAQFIQQAETLTATGERHTGREMSATDFTREAAVEGTINRIGVVRMSFHWEGFAVVDDGTVEASDVFEGGFYLMSDQSLEFRPGDGLTFETVRPEAQYAGTLESAPSVTWSGERDFADRYPYVVFSSDDRETVASDTESGAIPGWMRLVGATMAVLLIVGGVAFLARRSELLPDPIAVARSVVDDRVESTSTTKAGSPGTEPGRTSVERQSVELVSDEDRVTSLIEANGGRMKQVQIVEETDWSKSKVSMLLSEMEADGTISKLRVGRENIISLDGFEPEAAQSPHGDE